MGQQGELKLFLKLGKFQETLNKNREKSPESGGSALSENINITFQFVNIFGITFEVKFEKFSQVFLDIMKIC